MKNFTLSIGIAAYNEEANIGYLLKALLEQKISSAQLTEIIVVSDASTDKTDDIVRSCTDPRIKLIRQEKRGGASNGQNRLMESAQGDILILLDADILPQTESMVERLIAPIAKDPEVGLTSAELDPASPETFVEKVLARNHVWKREFFKHIGDGNNVYTCFGPARAFSRKIYTTMHYSNATPLDAISYFECVKRGMKFVFVSESRVLFRCPSTLGDHVKQSIRFISGRDNIIKEYGASAGTAYAIPRGALLSSMLTETLRHPILFMSFLAITLYVRTKKKIVFTGAWDVATSSKKLIK